MSVNKLEIIRGDDVVLHIVFTDENGDPVDITDASITFTAKKNFNSSASISTTVETHTSPAEGKTDITLSDTETSIDAGLYYYDLQITFLNGKINSIDYGELIIKRDITN